MAKHIKFIIYEKEELQYFLHLIQILGLAATEQQQRQAMSRRLGVKRTRQNM